MVCSGDRDPGFDRQHVRRDSGYLARYLIVETKLRTGAFLGNIYPPGRRIRNLALDFFPAESQALDLLNFEQTAPDCLKYFKKSVLDVFIL